MKCIYAQKGKDTTIFWGGQQNFSGRQKLKEWGSQEMSRYQLRFLHYTTTLSPNQENRYHVLPGPSRREKKVVEGYEKDSELAIEEFSWIPNSLNLFLWGIEQFTLLLSVLISNLGIIIQLTL